MLVLMALKSNSRTKMEKWELKSRQGVDVPSSTIRKLIISNIERNHEWYIGWRAAVLESDVEEQTRSCFAKIFNFFQSETFNSWRE